MAKRPRDGWEMAHNKRPTKTSMKDLRHRRQRRRGSIALRLMLRQLVRQEPSDR